MTKSPGGFRTLTAFCLAGAGLMFIPVEAARPLRGIARDALWPGQVAVNAALREGRAAFVAVQGSMNPRSANEQVDGALQEARLENRRLEVENARLREREQKLSDWHGLTPARASPPPLLTPRLVEARVLGEETAALWRGRKLLSAGAAAGVAESALVLDDPRPLVDLGTDAHLSPGDAVYAYAGRTVLGKIGEVGRYTSTLLLVTDSDYSGRARLARRTSRGLVFGAEGILVGDGSDLCRLKHMTDPVNVDDEVYTGGADGLVPAPMYYGKVVRAELEAGMSEWSVWVKPAAAGERLESVLILRRTINPNRVSSVVSRQ